MAKPLLDGVGSAAGSATGQSSRSPFVAGSEPGSSPAPTGAGVLRPRPSFDGSSSTCRVQRKTRRHPAGA